MPREEGFRYALARAAWIDPAPKALTTRSLTHEMWPAFEALFGDNGACGGCWCMHWRVEKGERWEDVKGSPARLRMKHLVMSGKAQGLLAFAGKEPIGWCAFGPRSDFARLNQSRTLACDDADQVWSIPCFFVRHDFRGRGVAARLLRDAVVAIRERGGRIAEGYPVRPSSAEKVPAAFAWTGVPSLFDKAGFDVVADGAKLRVRKAIRLKKIRAGE